MSQQDELRRFNRRLFLQSAVMGALGATVGLPKLAHADDGPQVSATGKGLLVYEGSLVGVSRDTVHVNVAGRALVAPLSPNGVLWRGAIVGTDSLRMGDDVLVQVQDGLVVKAWSNLRRIRGSITGRSGVDYVVHGGYGYAEHSDIGLRLNSATSITKANAGGANELTSLPVGTTVDAIGLMDGGLLRATLISYGLPGAPTKVQTNEKITAIKRSTHQTDFGPLAVCDTTYYGYASWYYCNSAAKCGTCVSSTGGACAWPKVTTYALCDVTSGCKNQSAAWCGKDIDVHDRCGGASVPCAVVDCGPCQTGCLHPLCNGANGNGCFDCLSSYTPIVDLTRATFSLFYDPSTHGCFASRCINTINC